MAYLYKYLSNMEVLFYHNYLRYSIQPGIARVYLNLWPEPTLSSYWNWAKTLRTLDRIDQSLLQSDIKILAKVLALRFNKVIASIVHPNQSGFMPQKSTVINLHRLFLNLQPQSDNVGDRALLSLDAHTAFDSIEWQYLWAVLGKFDFGKMFLSWVQLLYSSP